MAPGCIRVPLNAHDNAHGQLVPFAAPESDPKMLASGTSCCLGGEVRAETLVRRRS